MARGGGGGANGPALECMPDTGAALESGEASCAAVRVLVRAREAHPNAFADAEPVLVQAARTLSVRALQVAVAYWRQAVDTDRALQDEGDLRARRRLHVSTTMFGMVRVDGDLDPETGETVITALRTIVDAESRSPDPEDNRTPAQRRADALGYLCRSWLDSGERPTIAGERPHVTLVATVESLREGGSGGPCELEHTGPIHPQSARRIACDSSVSRVLLLGDSEPLDVGRRTRIVPPGLRRAVTARDGRCRFPGCDRPPPWCDAHHVVHWADGGPTALSNLVLLCRAHHRLVHRGAASGFSVAMIRGSPVFRRPDGSLLEHRGPPIAV